MSNVKLVCGIPLSDYKRRKKLKKGNRIAVFQNDILIDTIKITSVGKCVARAGELRFKTFLKVDGETLMYDGKFNPEKDIFLGKRTFKLKTLDLMKRLKEKEIVEKGRLKKKTLKSKIEGQLSLIDDIRVLNKISEIIKKIVRYFIFLS